MDVAELELTARGMRVPGRGLVAARSSARATGQRLARNRTSSGWSNCTCRRMETPQSSATTPFDRPAVAIETQAA
jgi:hypothetical protein